MAVFYVSAQTGNDSNNGTAAATAKATVQAGMDLMATAGDIVYIAPGVYHEKNITTTGGVNGADHAHNKKEILTVNNFQEKKKE